MCTRAPIGCAVLAACSFDPAISTTVSRAQLGTEPARLSGYFATDGGQGTHHELILLPKDIPSDRMRDDAVLVRISPDTCVDMTLRTDREPLISEHAIAMTVDDRPVQHTVMNERVRTDQVTYTPEAGHRCDGPCVHPITTTTARICAPVASTRKIELRFTHPTLVYRGISARKPYGLWFSWRLQ